MSLKCVDVENEYKKKKDLKKDDVMALKEWVEKQAYLPKLTELQLILFLHSCYYNNELAKITIDNFYTLRAHCPDFFKNRNPNDPVTKNIFILIKAPLPILTNEGYTIFYARLMDTNADKYNIPIHFKSMDMSAWLHLHQDGTSFGHVLLADLKGATLSHVAKVNLFAVKKFMYYFQEALPIRLKAIHFINIVPFMDKILALIKPFMKKELIEVLYIHTSMESVYKYIPKSCFPKDFGGNAPFIQEIFEKQKQNIIDNADFFVAEESVQVDESKRPGKPKDIGEIFGVEGTFKKLDID